MTWSQDEALVLRSIAEDEAVSTLELCNRTLYSFTDLVFVLNRMQRNGSLRQIAEHCWKKVPEWSSETPEVGV